MMDKLIARFTEQLQEAMEIGSAAILHPHDHDIYKVYVGGLGGSGIGADFVSGFIRNECPIPYLVGKGYEVPAYVDKHTLAIASSYSGNTEETLASFDQMMKTGAKVVVVASGGKLIELAKTHGLDFIQVPGNWPSPRACLGYSFVQQLYIMNKLGFISNGFEAELRASIVSLDAESADIRQRASNIANFLIGKTAVIYTTDRTTAVAVRFRQQLNENAKVLCWHQIIPEMNHNELVGWKDKREDLAVIVLRNADDFNRNQTRIDINKEIISELSASWIEIFSKGDSLIERSMYLVHLTDWISWYLADLRGVDSIEVNVIDYLKGELSKQPF
jgi:glucose/mannose-6-phosphate isomerase